jgi:hypothetical protein
MVKTNKNSISTQSYFIKRLRDSNFITIKIYDLYSPRDPRKWTIMVDPEQTALLVTCYQNKEFRGDISFEFNDGGNKFPKNYHLKTQSMEIVVTTLIERGIPQKDNDGSFEKKD